MGSKREEVRWREGVERETKQKRQGVKTSGGNRCVGVEVRTGMYGTQGVR